MNTPKGVNVAELVANARKIKGRVDAVIIPDMDNGVMRMSALAGGALIHQQGMEAIIHLYCRDRNRMALQGDVLAAHLLGIRNLVVVPGEEMANGDHHDAAVVNDLDELELIGAIRSLQNGVDMSGFSLNGNPEFITGCTGQVFKVFKMFHHANDGFPPEYPGIIFHGDTYVFPALTDEKGHVELGCGMPILNGGGSMPHYPHYR